MSVAGEPVSQAWERGHSCPRNVGQAPIRRRSSRRNLRLSVAQPFTTGTGVSPLPVLRAHDARSSHPRHQPLTKAGLTEFRATPLCLSGPDRGARSQVSQIRNALRFSSHIPQRLADAGDFDGIAQRIIPLSKRIWICSGRGKRPRLPGRARTPVPSTTQISHLCYIISTVVS